MTGRRTEVGNLCVKRFVGFRSDLVIAAIKRIRKTITKSLDADAIVFFNEGGLLTSWEYGFLQDTMSKRALSPAQSATRQKINEKVLATISRRGFRGPD